MWDVTEPRLRSVAPVGRRILLKPTVVWFHPPWQPLCSILCDKEERHFMEHIFYFTFPSFVTMPSSNSSHLSGSATSYCTCDRVHNYILCNIQLYLLNNWWKININMWCQTLLQHLMNGCSHCLMCLCITYSILMFLMVSISVFKKLSHIQMFYCTDMFQNYKILHSGRREDVQKAEEGKRKKKMKKNVKM